MHGAGSAQRKQGGCWAPVDRLFQVRSEPVRPTSRPHGLSGERPRLRTKRPHGSELAFNPRGQVTPAGWAGPRTSARSASRRARAPPPPRLAPHATGPMLVHTYSPMVSSLGSGGAGTAVSLSAGPSRSPPATKSQRERAAGRAPATSGERGDRGPQPEAPAPAGHLEINLWPREAGGTAAGSLRAALEEGPLGLDSFQLPVGPLTRPSPPPGAPRRAGRGGCRGPPVVSAHGGLRAGAAALPHAGRRQRFPAALLPSTLPAAATALRPGARRHHRLSPPGQRSVRRPGAPGTAAASTGCLGRAARRRPRPRRAAGLAGAASPRPGPRPSPGLRRRGATAPAQPGRRRAQPGGRAPWPPRAGGSAWPGGPAGEARTVRDGPGPTAMI